MYKGIFVIKLKSYNPLLLNEAVNRSHKRKLKSPSLFIQKLVEILQISMGFYLCGKKE